MGLKENQALIEQYPILQYFQYNHLPEDLRKISSPFNTIAWKVARELPHNAEKSVALRKLLEAKDAAVRAAIDVYAPAIPENTVRYEGCTRCGPGDGECSCVVFCGAACCGAKSGVWGG